MIFLNQLISAVLQIVLLTAIPFVWYLLTHRQVSGFFAWLGLFKAEWPPFRSAFLLLIGFLGAVLLPYLWLYHTDSLTYSGFTVDAYRATGWSFTTIGTVLVWAVLQTSLSEEIFFRGFLAKRLSHSLGWKAGTAVQAALFGAIHLPAVLGKGLLPAAVVAVLTGGIGYALGWLSVKKAEGSILYGWMVHAAANVISPVLVFAFLL